MTLSHSGRRFPARGFSLKPHPEARWLVGGFASRAAARASARALDQGAELLPTRQLGAPRRSCLKTEYPRLGLTMKLSHHDPIGRPTRARHPPSSNTFRHRRTRRQRKVARASPSRTASVRGSRSPTARACPRRWPAKRPPSTARSEGLAGAHRRRSEAHPGDHEPAQDLGGRGDRTRLGRLTPAELTSGALRRWVRELTTTLTGRGTPPAASTVRNKFNSLSKMLDDAIAEEWIALPANPMRGKKIRELLPAIDVPEPETSRT